MIRAAPGVVMTGMMLDRGRGSEYQRQDKGGTSRNGPGAPQVTGSFGLQPGLRLRLQRGRQ